MPRIIADGQPAGAGGGVATGDISLAAPFTQDIAAITAPAAGTLASTAIDTLDHSASVTTGQRFEFKIPDDYDSGDLDLKATYADDTGGGDYRLSTAAEIADVSAGTIDTATYSETEQTRAAPGSADEPTRVTLLTISSADFEAGDTIQFFVKRIGGDGADTAGGLWQVISYEIAYTGQVATRGAIADIVLFDDTDETAPSNGTKGNFNTIDFITGVDREQKFQFSVPDNWDEFSDAIVRVTYAMGAAEASKTVILGTEGDLADVSAGSTTSLGVENFDLNTDNDTDIHRTVAIRSIPASVMGVGDAIVLKLARRGSLGGDTHGDTFKLLSATVVFGVMPKTQFQSVVVEQHYLYAHDFLKIAGMPDGEQEEPDFSGDFETWLKMTGNGASEQINVSFQGRLMTTQTTIKSIKVPYKASTVNVGYRLKIYIEDADWASSPPDPVYDSGLITGALSTTRTVLTVTDATPDLDTRQPDFLVGREGRFFVVMEAYLDAGEILWVGRPYVGLE